jgi:hypothetical protein
MCLHSFGQRNVTSKLTIKQNDDVQIIFNGISDFENGVILDDWTILNIQFTDTLDNGAPSGGTNGWEMYVRADDVNIWSLSGMSFLPLETIEMEVYYDGSTQGTYALSNTDQLIANGTGKIGVDKDITLTYNVGTKPANKVESFTESHFIIQLIFTLQPETMP